jgi:hypothetical protein
MRTKPLTVAVERYLASRKSLPCERSVRRLRSVPRSLAEFLKREPTTADLTADTARQWLAWRAETVNERSIRHDSKALVSVWRWCYRRRYAGEPVTYFEIQPGGYRRSRPHGCPTATPGDFTRAGRRIAKAAARERKKRELEERKAARTRKAPPRPDVGWRGLLLRVFG